MSNKQQIGIVLLTTMIMMSLLSVLMLSLMQSVLLYAKVSNQIVLTHKLFYQLEAAAQALISSSAPPDCILTGEDPNHIIDLLLHQKGCYFVHNEQSYSYLIDDLGLYPCLRMLYKSHTYSSHHWLITIVSLPLSRVLQLRIAKPAKMITCDLKEHYINNEVLSWRYLSY